MATAAEALGLVINELGFGFVEPNNALGSVGEFPATITVLDVLPAAMMFTIRANTDAGNPETLQAAWKGRYTGRSNISFDPGVVWLELYGITEPSAKTLQPLMDGFADALTAAGFGVGTGCLNCGTLEQLQLTCADGRPTRMCSPCLGAAVQEKSEREAALNRPGRFEALGLPAIAMTVAVGWTVVWTLLDMFVEWAGIERISLDKLTGMIIAVLVLGVGYALGTPLGNALRRAGLGNWAPWLLSIVAVLGTALGGEILYIAVALWRHFGIFDLNLAAGLLARFFVGYSGFWITCKILCAAAMWLFCHAEAQKRVVVQMEV